MKTPLLFLFFLTGFIQAQNTIPESDFEELEEQVIEWRRDFHQHPELGNREFETAKKIAAHLESLGIEVQTGVAKTGVVGILKGNRPGKVVGLRADIDGLPVKERTDVPFKSVATSEFRGEQVPVMHACGHDTHIAILMGVAEILSKNNDFPGTVKFIFQPAEEGAPPGEEGGAKLMVEENVLKNPDVDAIFGLHISADKDVNTISYKPEGIMAASQSFEIKVKGKQSHGSTPWSGIDPIMASVKIIDGLQTIISREAELTQEAAVLSIGKIESGVRSNIIPEEATIIGTLRTLDVDMQKMINKRMEEMVPALAAAYRAEATIEIAKGYPITYNDPELTAKMLPTLQKVAGEENVVNIKAITGAEDFSFFAQEIPGLYFFLGGKTPGVVNPAPHHTPDFFIDESGLLLGVKTLSQLAIDYLNQ
ncbi:amidohydrolase [Salegentibacter sp. JZCK2]|uniref:amidohydrolase n=1 Tax=Salegentibacter tibetensis TaxID=2873600 RepID=UPI001CCD08C2|nr:amidohydrolase [Salegentibacter tibetensis]MBZ9731063.1 amidohydrolase [Salegentibacter tibetensis]